VLVNVIVPSCILQLSVALGLLVHVLEEEVQSSNSSTEANFNGVHLLNILMAVCFLVFSWVLLNQDVLIPRVSKTQAVKKMDSMNSDEGPTQNIVTRMITVALVVVNIEFIIVKHHVKLAEAACLSLHEDSSVVCHLLPLFHIDRDQEPIIYNSHALLLL